MSLTRFSMWAIQIHLSTLPDEQYKYSSRWRQLLDFTQDTQNDVTFNEAGVDIDFRIESADESICFLWRLLLTG